MNQFKDSKGDTWSVTVNGGTIKRARDLLKIDLGAPLEGDPPFLTRFDIDIALKVDVLFVVCLPEAKERQVSDVEFAGRLEGDALYEASKAFWETLADFFRKLHQPHVVRAIEKQAEVIKRAIKLADDALSGEEFQKRIDAELAELGEFFASSLQSPASTPSPEHSGN